MRGMKKNHVGEVIRTERIYIIIYIGTYINVWTVYLYNIMYKVGIYC